MTDHVSWESVLAPDREGAAAALRAVGATLIDELELQVDVAGLGRIGRRFGLIDTLPASGPVREVLADALAHPANQALADRLSSGALRHAPANKNTVRRLAFVLPPHRVHVPWALRPLNADLAAQLEDFAERRFVGFTAYYSQVVDLIEGGLIPRRVFSTPVRGTAHGTLHDPLLDELLDEEVGLLLESNFRSA